MAQLIQLLKHGLCDMQSGIVMEKNWALSVDQCQLQGLQFLVHLIGLLSILFRCNHFTRIQKAVVDQTNSRPPVTITFFWCKFGFGKCFGASAWSSPASFPLWTVGLFVFSNVSFCQYDLFEGVVCLISSEVMPFQLSSIQRSSH